MAAPEEISVIIPTYNSKDFVGKAIESVIDQSHGNLEIIVVDDGSDDNTEAALKKHSSRITFLQQRNLGPAAARNLGIRHAKGEYIAFLDSDDLWFPRKIEKQMEVFRRNNDAAFVYSMAVDFDNKTGNEVRIFPKEVYSGKIFDKLLLENPILLSTAIVRSNILRKVGGFDQTLRTAEDTNLYLRIARNHLIMGVEEVLVRRRIHDRNLKNRFDISAGTIDNLDKIVEMFPDTSPENYVPMRSAYIKRGNSLISSCFLIGNYSFCRKSAKRMVAVGAYDATTLRYYFLTLLPNRLLSLIVAGNRKIKKRTVRFF